jgi:dTDP-4-dehydrorhamnose reductase
MRVLITGAGGQLGSDLRAAFADHDVVALGHDDLDVTHEPSVMAAVGAAAPQVVVHAAAYTAVDACEDRPHHAWQVNALGAWWVARAAQLAGAAMVYPSTDYVFDGMLGRPYTEFDPVSPASVYGRSKEAGEQLVRRACDAHYIVRTSWVHGRVGANFAKTMLRLGRQQATLRVVDDQTGSPTFTFDLAPAMRRLAVSGRHGTYHLTNAGSCTWFELARAIFAEVGLEVDVSPTDAATWGAPAPRPPYSVLDNHLARLLDLEPLPPWRNSLRRLLADLGEPVAAPSPAAP